MISRRKIILVIFLISVSCILGYLAVLSHIVPQANKWAVDATQISTLHMLGYDGSGITIGIIDTGAYITHQEFDDSSFKSWSDIINQQESAYDDDDHGTHLTGLLVAQGSYEGLFSGVNLKGIVPQAELIVVKAIPMNQFLYGGGNDSVLAAGIDFCLQHNVDIIILSMGVSPEKVDFSEKSMVTQAIDTAVNQGVFIVVPAGNDGQADDGDVCFPANHPEVIAVGSISKSSLISSFSSKGHQFPGTQNPNKKPELVAPGEGILSTRINNAYGEQSGTAQAAVYTAGVVALLLEAYPEYKPGGVLNNASTKISFFKEIFASTAKKIGSLEGNNDEASHDDWYGYGLIQAYEAYKKLSE